jgi:hypothetical protein
MKLPIISVIKNNTKKPSLLLTLLAAGLLIGVGGATFWFLSQKQTSSRGLPVGVNIIPQDALLTVSLTTDPKQWQKLQELGTTEMQAEITKNLVQLRDRFLTENGYDFQTDITPWVGDQVTLGIFSAPTIEPGLKPLDKNKDSAIAQQSIIMVLPVKNLEAAQNMLAEPKTLKQGKWTEHIYQGITIRQTNNQSGEKLSAALLDQRFLVLTDDPQAAERVIDTYKGKPSLATLEGFGDNLRKIANYRPFAQFYLNVPIASKLAAAATPDPPFPAQVLTQLQNNQGLAGSVTLEAEGIRLTGIWWRNSQSQRLLKVDKTDGIMQNRLPADTLMMLSHTNLQNLWEEYVLISQKNPLSPISPEKLRGNVKSLTGLDLDKDFLSWMQGEFSVSVIPNSSNNDYSQDYRAGLLLMVQARDASNGESLRKSAEASLKKLDEVMQNQYQFQIQPSTVAGKPVVNWITPFNTLTATHGWLDNDIAFLVVGAPITDKIIPKPEQTLASRESFQQTVPKQSHTTARFFLDMETSVKDFALNTVFPQQQAFLDATQSIGMTSAVSDERSMRYEIFIILKKGETKGAG